MTWESALESVIEVSIAIAGFSGIVAAVGRRGAGHWTQADQLRLRILLTASGMGLCFAFLPFILVDLIDPAIAWRVLSGLLAFYTVGITAYRFRQASVAGLLEAMGLRAWGLFPVMGVVLILVANALWLGHPSLYLIGVIWGVFIAFMTFVALLLGAWHRPGEMPLPTA